MTTGVTPAMRQFFSFKSLYPGHLICFRRGDFYEFLLDDAVSASNALSITLTSRRNKAAEGGSMKMAGIPQQSLELYLGKLVAKGFRVAVCDQVETMEEAKQAGRAVVNREVTRIVTPGTFTGSNNEKSNFLACVGVAHGALSLAWIDVGTGAFSVCQLEHGMAELSQEISRLTPSEILIPDGFLLPETGGDAMVTTYTDADEFNHSRYSRLIACGALTRYLKESKITCGEALPERFKATQAVTIDFNTREALEFPELFKCVDQTSTLMGKRMLRAQLTSPIRDEQEIGARLDRVQYFFERPLLLKSVTRVLAGSPDVERATQRLVAGGCHFSDLRDIAIASQVASEIALLVPEWSEELMSSEHLQSMISSKMDADGILDGVNSDIDALRRVQQSRDQVMARMSEELTRKHGEPMNVRFNARMGAYIETGKLLDIPADFLHVQTRKTGAMRFKNQATIDLEESLGQEKLQELEHQVLKEIAVECLKDLPLLRNFSTAMASLDVALSNAKLALEQGFVRPEVLPSNEDVFDIRAGRHVVVERRQLDSSSVVPNDCILGQGTPKLSVISGPNMGGKSMFLRQNALIAVLAQSGAFVPAKTARMSIVDSLFMRVGASDDLTAYRSTFMVEMEETARILRHATKHSLICMDEVGRGTSSEDGEALAQAVMEELAKMESRCLFATHFRQLQQVALKSPKNMKPFNLAVIEDDAAGVIFTHKLVEGCATKTYSLHVAELAGIPKSVIERARELQ